MSGVAKRLGASEAVVTEADEAVTKGIAVTRREIAENGFGKDVGGVGGECGDDGLENGVGFVSCSPFSGWGKEWLDDAG